MSSLRVYEQLSNITIQQYNTTRIVAFRVILISATHNVVNVLSC